MEEPRPRVLVVDDDVDTAGFVATVLERRGGMDVTIAHDGRSALALTEAQTFDLVLTDIQMPGMTGLELLVALRERAPQTAVVVMTAFASVDYAVDALRKDADEFLVKPVSAATLLERVPQILRAARERAAAAAPTAPRQVVLAVGAHPDDVEIGVGGTLAQHHAVGDTVAILTLSQGGTGGNPEQRRSEAQAAASLVGAELVIHAFADTRLALEPELIPAIEAVVNRVEPTIVYTHSPHDRHQDHRAVYEAVQVAVRRVPQVECFQSPSSTIEFRPTRFAPIDDFVDAKLALVACHASQKDRDYMEPEVVRATARYWSRFGVGKYAEPLETVRATATVTGRERVANDADEGSTA